MLVCLSRYNYRKEVQENLFLKDIGEEYKRKNLNKKFIDLYYERVFIPLFEFFEKRFSHLGGCDAVYVDVSKDAYFAMNYIVFKLGSNNVKIDLKKGVLWSLLYETVSKSLNLESSVIETNVPVAFDIYTTFITNVCTNVIFKEFPEILAEV